MPDSLLTFAISYAEAGYRIFPCHYPLLSKNSQPTCSCKSLPDKPCKVGKHPMIREWTTTASSDPDQIKDWWTKRPYANIGMLAGEPNGFDVLDEDPKDGGDVALKERTEKFGILPSTVQSRTGSGGDHFFFRHHPGLKNNNHGKIAKGLDFRTTGGQIIAPPSLHVSGQRYEWVVPPTADNGFADPPSWLLEAMQEDTNTLDGRYTKVSADEWEKIARGVSGGDRHNALLRLAGHLLAVLPSPHLAITLTHAYNETMCDTPKDGDEVDKILNFIIRKRLRRLH